MKCDWCDSLDGVKMIVTMDQFGRKVVQYKCFKCELLLNNLENSK